MFYWRPGGVTSSTIACDILCVTQCATIGDDNDLCVKTCVSQLQGLKHESQCQLGPHSNGHNVSRKMCTLGDGRKDLGTSPSVDQNLVLVDIVCLKRHAVFCVSSQGLGNEYMLDQDVFSKKVMCLRDVQACVDS